MKQLKYALVMFLTLVTGSMYGQTLDELVARFNKGADEINKGDFMSAITDLNDVLAMSESVTGKEADDLVAKAKQQIPLLHYQVAISYIKQKDYEKAVPYLEQTIELATKYDNNQEYKVKSEKYLPPLLVGVGTQKYRDKQLDSAMYYFEDALKFEPNYAKAFLGEGLIYFDKKNEDKMTSSLTKAISLAKADNDTKTVELATETLTRYWLDMGDSELQAVDPENEDFTYAIDAYDKALGYDSTNTDANYKLAIIYNREVQYEKAAKHGEKALSNAEGEDKLAAINYELGNAYMGMAEYDKACAAYTKAMTGAFEEKAAAKKDKVPGCQ
jgi:tetratricopeptide (TPR) repeat protein